MEKIIFGIGTVVVGVFVLLFISFLLSWPVYMLWNGCLVGAIEGVKEVSWMQAWGISFLFGMLFKERSVSFKD
jgi:hypothetical protein